MPSLFFFFISTCFHLYLLTWTLSVISVRSVIPWRLSSWAGSFDSPCVHQQHQPGRSRGHQWDSKLQEQISSWTPGCVKSSIHPGTDLLQFWEGYLPLSSSHLCLNSCPHQLLMDQILNANQGGLTVWFPFSVVIDVMFLALFWCWYLCKAPCLHQRSTPSCVQIKGWIKQALLMKDWKMRTW